MRNSVNMRMSVERLDALREGETRELIALRTVSDVIRAVLEAQYKQITMARVFAKLSVSGLSDPLFRDRLLKVTAEIEQREQDVQRCLEYLKIIGTKDGEDIQILLSRICGHYPDEITIEFLTRIEPLVPSVAQEDWRSERQRLIWLVRGHDPSSWTGRR